MSINNSRSIVKNLFIYLFSAHYAGGEKITFEYLDHQKKKHRPLTLTQEEMVLRLISHIPEKHFKMIRYAGFLSNRLRKEWLPLVYQALSFNPGAPIKLSYAAMLKSLINTDPFKCILCQHRMVFEKAFKGMSVKELCHDRFKIALLKPVVFR